MPFVLALLAALLPAAILAEPLPPNVVRTGSSGGITEYRLHSNGMPLLLVEDHAAPVFTFMVVYHVGSRNEAPGFTGSAHLLEHLLFNRSTESFGTASGNPSFQEVLFEAGADYGSTNMTTWNDRMNGYSTLPSDQLELAMRIEADRMRRGLLLEEERELEMTIVRNEYEIGENNPVVALGKAVVGTAIVAHPYHWDTIGYKSDIEGVSTARLREHYDTFFWPDNATAILVGDVDPTAALRLFDAQFGAFPKAPEPIPEIVTEEPDQEGERRVVVKRPGGVGMVLLGYTRPGALHPDHVPFDLLAEILAGGVTSRLQQGLVETGLATDVDAFNVSFRDPYPFFVQATVAPGRSHDEVEAALRAEIERIGSEGVTAQELGRARRQLEVRLVAARDGSYELASSLGEAVASADWRWFVRQPELVAATTAEDLRRITSLYLHPDRVTVGWYVPVGAEEAPPRPDLSIPSPPTAATGADGEEETEPAAATTEPRSFAERTVRTIFPNGLVLDVVANPAVASVAVEGTLLAGHGTAPEGHPALPELTAAMVQRGAGGRSKLEIASTLEDVGASLELDTGQSQVQISGGGLARDLPVLLTALADALVRPDFPAAELEKTKAEMENTIKRRAESTTFRAIERLTQLALPPGHPARFATSEAFRASLRRATVDDLRQFHQTRYGGRSLVLAIAGDVEPEEVVEEVGRLFASLPSGVAPPVDDRAEPAPARREIVPMPRKANMNLVFGQASGLRRTDEGYEAALLANAAFGQSSLSSRLGKRVRDAEGLSYHLYSRLSYSGRSDGLWLANVNVAPENLEAAYAASWDELETYLAEGMTAAELVAQQRYFAGHFQVGLGSNAGIARALVEAEGLGRGPAELDEFPVRIQSITLEQANAALRRLLDPDRIQLVVAGDLEVLPTSLESR